jgi:hypothetical protein
MYAVTHHPPIVSSQAFRWAGRVGGVAMFVVWACFVAFEATRPTSVNLPTALYLQAAALAIVFMGYAVGWTRELVGAALVALGLSAFLAVTYTDTALPGLAIAWFLGPAALYLLADITGRWERGTEFTEPRK